LSYKTKLSTFLLWFLPLSSSLRPPTPKRRRSSLAGILPNSTTPPRFRWPRASSPPPLVPQLDPVQLRPCPSPESPHSEPPLTGAIRASPRRRQPPPLAPRPIQVWRSFPPRLLMLLRTTDGRVHRPSAGNDDAPPRPPPLLAAGRALALPVESLCAQLISHSLLVVPGQSLPAGDHAAGGNVPEPTVGRRRGLAGTFV
jgi:hypothetical protein